MKFLQGYGVALPERQLMPTALKVAVVVGRILFTINHGSTLVPGQITRSRLLSGLLTYLVPYGVNVEAIAVNRGQ